MNDHIEVIGNTSSIIDYNLNEQYSNVKKIIISGEKIISSFEDVGANDIFEKLSNSTLESYASNLRSAIDSGILDSTINSQLYKEITDNLSSISETMMDIQLQGYNFMNSVSNSKFTLTLRCESFSVSRYYEERGSFLSIIRSLILDYLEFFGNTQRLKRLKNFQIEIYESEEIHKHIFLKKDGSKLILATNFGFPKSSPIDFSCGSEFYFSTGKGFNFFRNSQTSAILREHNKLVESPIQTRDKILSDDELITINNTTKHISDAVIELYLTKKGKLNILNVSALENTIHSGSDNGFYINKSSKNYDKISLLTLRDDLVDEMPNPKYLLLRNSNEVQSFLSNTDSINYIDGLVLMEHCYTPYLDAIGDINDIDVIFQKHELNKSYDIELNQSQVLIGSNDDKVAVNPFNNILDDKNKERDERLERLKNVDLSTPQHIEQNRQMEQQAVNQLAEGLIASPNSSMNNTSNPNSYGSTPMPQSTPGKKLSAIDMLMHAAENKPAQQPQNNFAGQQNQMSNTAQSAVNSTTMGGGLGAAAAASQAQAPPVSNPNSYGSAPIPQSTPGKKLSAFDLLMHAAENKPAQPTEQPIPEQPQAQPEPQQIQQNGQQYSNPQNQYNQPAQEQYNQHQNQPVQNPEIDIVYSEPKHQPTSHPQEQTGMVDHFAMYDEPKEQVSDEQNIHNQMLNRELVEDIADEIIVEDFQQNTQYNNTQTDYQNNFESEQIPQELQQDLNEIESEITQLDSIEHNELNQIHTTEQSEEYMEIPNTPKVDIERYNDIISTKIITLPTIESQSYFVDSSNLGEITTGGDLYFLTPTDENLTNDNLNYVIPLGVSDQYSDKHNYIVNSANDYFLLGENQKLNLFINLSYIDESIKETFLIKCLNHAKSAYVVCLKQDIKLLEKHINKLTGVFVKDLDSTEELNEIEYSILSFEKNYLMKKFN